MAMLSILGLYNLDPTIFDYLTLPTLAEAQKSTKAELISEPFEPDKETLIAYICMELAELSLVYPSPDSIKEMIRVWSRVHHQEWVDLYATMIMAYNPIWNKDGTRTHTVEGDLHVMTGGTHTNTGVHQTTENWDEVTGFDSTEPQPYTHSKTKTDGDIKDNQNTFVYDSQKDHANYTETDSETGNIGVTTTQQMLKEQREIVQYNLYKHICDEFKEQFCVMVY